MAASSEAYTRQTRMPPCDEVSKLLPASRNESDMWYSSPSCMRLCMTRMQRRKRGSQPRRPVTRHAGQETPVGTESERVDAPLVLADASERLSGPSTPQKDAFA